MTITLPESADVLALLEDMWSAYIDSEAGLIPDDGVANGAVALSLAAGIAIKGPFTTQILVATSDSGARQVAAALLQMPVEEVGDEDTADALAEVANIVGGGLKGLLPSPSALSLPVVVRGRDLGAPGEVANIVRAAVRWRDIPLVVSLWSHSQEH